MSENNLKDSKVMNKLRLSHMCMFVVAVCNLLVLIPSTTCQAIATTGLNTKNSIIASKQNSGKTTGVAPLPGTIKFVGTVQSINPSSLTMGMPDGQKLLMKIVQAQTNLASLQGVLPTVGQIVKVTAIVNLDGSFTASELELSTPDPIQASPTVSYRGVTTSTVGTDNKLNFKVGTMSFSFPIGATAKLQDFNSDAHTIGTNITVKAEVLFNGTTGTIVSVDNKQANIEFTGKVQSITPSSITMGMPDGQKLSINIVQAQTNLADLNNALPTVGQIVKATATVNPDNSFTASELGLSAPDELTTVKYQGVTTSTVGTDNKLNFKVGTMSFSFPIGPTANLQDFNSDAHTIGTNTTVKADVLFTGTAGTIVSIENEQANIKFTGAVQSITPNSVTMSMPDGQKLSMNIEGLKGTLPSVGQIVQTTATVNPDGSFTTSKLQLSTPGTTQEPPTVTYQGVTTSTVGTDNKLNFKVGTMSFSFPIGATAKLQDFNSNVHAIASNMIVKAEVLFTGTTGSVVSVENGQAYIKFTGRVQSITPHSLTMGMPNGQKLSMNIVSAQTNLASLQGVLPTVGQLVKVTATLNPDGSFTASELELPPAGITQKLTSIKYQGVTTSAVGTDNKLNFKVGTMSFSFPISGTADLQDFNSSVHAIASNMMVKAEVLFTGSAGSVVSIKHGND